MAQVSKNSMAKCCFSCKDMEVNLSLEEIRPYLSEDEYKRVASIKSKSFALQKAHAYYLIKKLIGSTSGEICVGYMGNGRPCIYGKNIDISISHKENIVYVGMASNPYRIGIDVECLDQRIDADVLKDYFLNAEEIAFLKEYSIRRNLPIASALIIFWSIKESFFKCLGYNFKPKEMRIMYISDDGKAILSCSERVKELMEMFSLEFAEITLNKKYVYARTLMRWKSPRP